MTNRQVRIVRKMNGKSGDMIGTPCEILIPYSMNYPFVKQNLKKRPVITICIVKLAAKNHSLDLESQDCDFIFAFISFFHNPIITEFIQSALHERRRMRKKWYCPDCPSLHGDLRCQLQRRSALYSP